MYRVVKIDQDKNLVFIGNDDGSLKTYSKENFSFNPNIGDTVEIFETDDVVVVSKVIETNKGLDSVVINNNMNQTMDNTKQEYIDLLKVKKWTYFFFAFLLGSFGAHHFYSNKPGKGFMFLLFCWTGIPTLLSLFTSIKVLFKKPDSEGYIYL